MDDCGSLGNRLGGHDWSVGSAHDDLGEADAQSWAAARDRVDAHDTRGAYRDDSTWRRRAHLRRVHGREIKDCTSRAIRLARREVHAHRAAARSPTQSRGNAFVGRAGPDHRWHGCGQTVSRDRGTVQPGHEAVLLDDGRVLLAGGVGTGWTFLATAEIHGTRWLSARRRLRRLMPAALSPAG